MASKVDAIIASGGAGTALRTPPPSSTQDPAFEKALHSARRQSADKSPESLENKKIATKKATKEKTRTRDSQKEDKPREADDAAAQSQHQPAEALASQTPAETENTAQEPEKNQDSAKEAGEQSAQNNASTGQTVTQKTADSQTVVVPGVDSSPNKQDTLPQQPKTAIKAKSPQAPADPTDQITAVWSAQTPKDGQAASGSDQPQQQPSDQAPQAPSNLPADRPRLIQALDPAADAPAVHSNPAYPQAGNVQVPAGFTPANTTDQADSFDALVAMLAQPVSAVDKLTSTIQDLLDPAFSLGAASGQGTASLSLQPHVPAAANQPQQPADPSANLDRFIADNHPRIISGVTGQLMPHGGTMHIRLDPPELGALQVSIEIRQGVVTASFETSSPEATRLLGHTLNDLRQTLEAHGLSIDKLHVSQSDSKDSQFKDARDGSNPGSSRQSLEDQQSARQEQQRRELMQRLWRRLSLGSDPIDLVA